MFLLERIPAKCMAIGTPYSSAMSPILWVSRMPPDVDVPWWASLVEEGANTPIVSHGWIEVPNRPGLGVTLSEDVVRQHLAPNSGYFEPTPQWDQERSWDRLWS